MQADRMQQLKNTVELDLRPCSCLQFHAGSTLLVSLRVSDISHSIHLQVVQCGISGPDQETARRSFTGKLLHLVNFNRRL